ncbi:MAG: TrkA C-terminal domain-containing protein [Pseudomonadota bacterium]
MWQTLINNQILPLLLIVLVGYSLGHLKLWGVSLGSSACLFVAITAGFAGYQTPTIITELGIVFFVYAVGIQAGPQFFRLFRVRGVKFLLLAFFATVFGIALSIFLAKLFHINTSLAVGTFAGALTSTPTLATAIDAIQNYIPGTAGAASLGYAISYPFGLISLILLVQLVPRFFSKQIQEDRSLEAKQHTQHEIKTRCFRLTNANLAGKTINEINLHDFCQVNLTRYQRHNEIHLCLPQTKLALDDIVVAVGKDQELDKAKMLLGEEMTGELPFEGTVNIRDIFVSGSKITGKALKKLRLRENYGITVTRIYRGDIAITPTSNMFLEVGDSIRIIGNKENLEHFINVAGSEKRRLDDTNILILSLGMLTGVLLGEIPIVLGNFTFKLGNAGGPLIMALIISHFGKIGPWSVRLPNATKFFLRDIGLVFFLVGVGTKTGHFLPEIIAQHNIWPIFVLGALIASITTIAAFIFAHNILHIPMLTSLGAICGALTSSPALGVLVKSLDDESPVISYAAVYPVAVILLTITGQVFVLAAIHFLG